MLTLATAFLATSLVVVTSANAADATLPAAAAGPLGSVGIPGFTVRTVQAPTGTPLANSYLRAVQQLNGTLVDADGNAIANEAVAGPNADGSYDVDLLNLGDNPNNLNSGQFPDDIFFPGLIAPEDGGHTGLFATEVITYVRLAAGSYTMGVTAGLARTDEVDDDGWKIFSGVTARDFFATPLGEFQRTGAAFPNGPQQQAGNTNQFTFTAPVDGAYPFRLVHWQTTRRTMLEWYIVGEPGTETEYRYLINDLNVSEPIAFRSLDVAAANGPSVVEAAPLPGSAGVSPAAPIEAVIEEGPGRKNAEANRNATNLLVRHKEIYENITETLLLNYIVFRQGRPGTQRTE